ncbi:DUF4832 domain-containing protein [Paraflavisolibacter sp. H34]|uniref:DUF4832 domain-containing protein n=1 Tax=Huijunlia imazamoxiresistens TaxID=3127457 RepID=UPI00301AEA16
MKKIVLSLLILTHSLLACKKGGSDAAAATGPSDPSEDQAIRGNSIISPEPETEKLLRNPMTGWAIYGSAGVTPSFWTDFDNLTVPELPNQKVKVGDYANILYIRTGWADWEPKEGAYAWNNNDIIKMLIKGAKDRGMKLAFRIVVDSRDKPRDFTPPFVREAGARGYYTNTGSKTVWSPYPDDPVFQQKYTNFVKAFAAQFDDPDVVDFVDGYGLGKWGEAHTLKYLNDANKTAVFDWIVDLYLEQFKKVPLAINYHRLIGATKEWGDPDPQSKLLLASALSKGYMLRHDAFGMTSYYGGFEKNIVKEFFPSRPVIVEGGWLHNGNGYQADPRGYKTWGDAWKGEYDDAVEARANVMDFRDIKEASSWFETSYGLIREFIATGGYRLYPDRISLPKTVANNSTIRIAHRWKNLGIGMCPTNLPQWNQKYKVAFALLDKQSGAIKSVFVDTQTDLSKWLKAAATAYEFSLPVRNIPAGAYQWAVAIVDTTKNNEKGINLSVKNKVTAYGWLPLLDVTVNE